MGGRNYAVYDFSAGNEYEWGSEYSYYLCVVNPFSLKKAPKVYSYVLWMVVLFCLLCPVSFTSDISLYGIIKSPTKSSVSIGNISTNMVYTEYMNVDNSKPSKEDIVPEGLEKEQKQVLIVEGDLKG